jgi:hypothetical protein
MRFLVQSGFIVAGLYDYSLGVSYSGIKPKNINSPTTS